MPSSLIDVIRQQVAIPSGPSAVPARLDEPHDLLTALARVPDPRDPRGVRCSLAGLLAVAVCTVLAGAGTFAAIIDWAGDLDPAAGTRLGFTGRIPALTTLWRLLIRIDAQILQAVLTDWLHCRRPTPAPTRPRTRRVVAIDGKVMRGARLPDGRQVHLLSAYDTTAGIVLAQIEVAAKSNEIPTFTPLVEQVAARLGGLHTWCLSPTPCTRRSPTPETSPPSAGTCTCRSRPTSRRCSPSSRACRGRRSRSGTPGGTPGTHAGRPARSKR
jgi:hypothetical protein